MALIKESSKSASERPGLATGGLVAAMLTAALISVFYLAWKVVGLPFVPFDAFDWMARILPGQVLAAGIDAMITVIRAFNLGPTAAAAKTAEHVMAIAGMFFMGLFEGRSSSASYGRCGGDTRLFWGLPWESPSVSRSS